MKTFVNQAAQGDLFIRRIDSLPNGLSKIKPEKGRYIVAHSETGHHHVIEASKGVALFRGEDPLVAYLRVIGQTEVTLEHLRNFDTHEALVIPGGTYEIRRQREYTPEGWRQVAD
jgi:hypothetical protein